VVDSREEGGSVPALNIKDPEVHKLAAELPEDNERVIRRVMEIAQRIASLPVLDPRTPDEIIGYDEHGVPE
jgi:antitoxin VapB